MVETTYANSLDEYLEATAAQEYVLFRGQSRHYQKIVPSLFRLPEPLDITPLLNAADELYLAAHGVDAEMARLRKLDEHYLKPFERSCGDDLEEEKTGLWSRFENWLSKQILPELYRRDDSDSCSDQFDLMNLPLGSGMGTTADYSKISAYVWQRVPNERQSMAMLQHYGAPAGSLDVSFERLVSLWFACHVLVQKDGHAFYKPNEQPGIVYIMNVSGDKLIDIRCGENIEFDDRTVVVPVAGLRGWRQRGGLVFGATMDDPDLTRYVVKQIIVAPGAFVQNDDRLKWLTQQELFPSPEEDDYYSALLKAKNSTNPRTSQLAGYIPLYVTP